VIQDVTVIDGTGRPARGGATIVIEGDRIRTVADVRETTVPSGARVIDGRGKFAIPGLMDVHVHLALREGPEGALRALHSYLYAGVTTIYDAGNDPATILPLRDRERAGTVMSPRIFASGALVTSPNGHGVGAGGGREIAVTIADWERDRAKLDAHIAQKPDVLKITYDEHGWGTRPRINILSEALLERIVDYYHQHGIPVTIHISSETRALEAIRARVDSLAHPIIQGPVSEEYVKYMAATRIPQVTTLTIGEGYSRLAEHPEFLDQPLYRDTIDPAEIHRLKTEESARQKTNRWAQWMKVMTPVCQDNLRKQHEAGAIIALGTDQSSGAAVHREIELLADAGISPTDIITIATRNAAVYLGREKDLGTIEPGKLADIVLLAADPTAHVDNLKRIDLVMKNGRIVDRGALDLPVNRRTSSKERVR
jgi:imidazolonepropionase-like amidohydrolase